MTSKPEAAARATRSRQLLVPRSMAAKVCAKRPVCQPPFGPDRGMESPAISNSFLSFPGPDGSRGTAQGRARNSGKIDEGSIQKIIETRAELGKNRGLFTATVTASRGRG